MSSVYVLVDIVVAVDLSPRHEQELRGIWATALRLPASAVLLVSTQGDGKGFRLAVRVGSEAGQSIDGLFERIQNAAQVNFALRELQVCLWSKFISPRLLSIPPAAQAFAMQEILLSIYAPCYNWPSDPEYACLCLCVDAGNFTETSGGNRAECQRRRTPALLSPIWYGRSEYRARSCLGKSFTTCLITVVVG